jgi:hypothetical protein
MATVTRPAPRWPRRKEARATSMLWCGHWVIAGQQIVEAWPKGPFICAACGTDARKAMLGRDDGQMHDSP